MIEELELQRLFKQQRALDAKTLRARVAQRFSSNRQTADEIINEFIKRGYIHAKTDKPTSKYAWYYSNMFGGE